MYLVSQMASFLFLTFLLGIGVGYALWRSWGEREVVAKFNAAEMRLAAHLARWEQTAKQQGAEEAAVRKAEAAAEKKLADFAKTLGYDMGKGPNLGKNPAFATGTGGPEPTNVARMQPGNVTPFEAGAAKVD